MRTTPRLERLLYRRVLREAELNVLRSTVEAIALGFALLAGLWIGSAFWLDATTVRIERLLPAPALFGVTFLLSRLGLVPVAALLLQASLLGMVTAGVYMGGGVYSPIAGHYGVSILTGGLLFGGWGAWLSAALAAVALLPLLPTAESPSLLGPLATQSAPVQYAVHAGYFVVVAALVSLGRSWLAGAMRAQQEGAATLRERGRALERSRERFRQLAEHSHDLVVEHDMEGRMTYVSPSVLRAMRKGGDEVLGRANYGWMHPDDVAGVSRAFAEILAREGSGRLPPYRTQLADGTVHWMESATSVFDTPGGERRMVTVSRDVTDRVLREEELERRVAERTRELHRESQQREQVQEELRQTRYLAAIGTLAAGVAHEINNPVGSILAAAEYARGRQREGGGEEVDSHLEKIEIEALRCRRIVESVLTFARDTMLEKRVGHLNEVVSSARDHLQDLALGAGATLDIELADGLPAFEMNATELERALANLVRNSVESGGAGTKVELRTEPCEEGVRLRIRDDGPGIPAHLRARVLDPFFTTRRREGGVGLGLSIVHGVVADHRGSMRFAEPGGPGTEVVIEFPAREAAA